MSQVFTRRAQLGVKLALVAIALAAVGSVVLAVSGGRSALDLGRAQAQPIAFSHKHHVGDIGIDCRYCHTTVETTAFAGLPSTSICLSCHSQLYRDAPILAPLRQSEATGVPIAWKRVHSLPDFVYFDHSIHVAKGVACVECHGRVDQMPLVWRVAPLEMQWCLQCHRDPAPRLRAPDAVFAMDAPAPTAAETKALVGQAHLQDRRRLTDCSTCHR